MNRRFVLLGAGAVLFGAGTARAQTQYFDAQPSAPALQRGLAPPPAMTQEEFGRMRPENRPRVGIMVNFEFNSAELTPQARATLDVLGEAIDKMPAFRFLIEGHTDAVGGDEYNLTLSRHRANAAVAYLATRHRIEVGRLEAIGYGKRRLRDAANPTSGINRRVEIANQGWIPNPTVR